MELSRPLSRRVWGRQEWFVPPHSDCPHPFLTWHSPGDRFRYQTDVTLQSRFVRSPHMTTPALELVQQRLADLCATRGIQRFSPEEMVQLLEDGEDPSWIVEQVLPDGPGDAAAELDTVLEAIAAQVAPPGEEQPSSHTDAADGAETESAADDTAVALEGLELPPGIDRAQVEELLSSPRGALLADFGVYCEERGFSQENARTLGTGEVDDSLRELHDEWMVTPRQSLEGKRPQDLLAGGLFPEKVKTFRREAPKVGRNDPCPCGSGKKYKKCCDKS